MQDKTLATFRFMGDDVDPALVTSTLGILPSEAHRKGEPRDRHPESRYRTGFWGLDSDLPQLEPLESHLSWLLNILEPKIEAIKVLVSSGYRADFYCSYFMGDESRRQVALSSVVLQRLGSAGADLTVNIYCDEDSSDT